MVHTQIMHAEHVRIIMHAAHDDEVLQLFMIYKIRLYNKMTLFWVYISFEREGKIKRDDS